MSCSRWVRLYSLRRPLDEALDDSWSSNRFWITRGLSTLPLPDIATLIAWLRSSGVASFNR